MSFLTQKLNEARTEYMSHVRPEIAALAARGQVSQNEWDRPMNGYERELLLPKLVDSVLLNVARYYLSQCAIEHAPPNRPHSTYDNALLGVILPELLGRFAERLKIPSGVVAVLSHGDDGTRVQVYPRTELRVPHEPSEERRRELMEWGLTPYDLTDDGLKRIHNLPVGYVT